MLRVAQKGDTCRQKIVPVEYKYMLYQENFESLAL